MIATMDELIDYYEALEEQESNNRDRRGQNNPQNANRRNNNFQRGNRNNSSSQNRDNRQQNRPSNQSSSSNQRTNTGSMWCDYHKTDTHDNRNCRAQQATRTGARNYGSSTDRRENRENQPRHPYNTRSQAKNASNNRFNQREETHQHTESSDTKVKPDVKDNKPRDDDSSSSENESIYANFETTKTLDNNQPDKPQEVDYVPELVIGLLTRVSQRKYKFLRALVDSGASRSILHATSLPKNMHSLIKDDAEGTITWETKGGLYETKHTADLWFQLTEFAPNQHFKHTFKIDTTTSNTNYDIILGRDLFQTLKLDLIWSEDIPCIEFQDQRINMKPRGFWTRNNLREMFYTTTLERAEKEFERRHRFTPAIYEKANLRNCLPPHLSAPEKQALFQLLNKYSSLFQGKLGLFPGAPVTIKLKPNAKPFHGRAFPVPKIHEQLLKDEVNRVVGLGVLKKVNNSEWASPSFGIPKKNGEIRFVSDFRRLNQQIVRHPFPLPSIPETIRNIDGFTYCSTIDVSMGFWCILLDKRSQRLCTIILPWGKYSYVRLPMGLSVSPDIYQEKMASLFEDMAEVKVYIDDILIITKGSFHDHLSRLEEVFRRLLRARLQLNVMKCSFCALETEYLGFVLTPKGIKPMTKRVQAILQISSPKTIKQVRSFIGMINHYKHMIPQRAHLITPLANLTKKGVSFKWTTECETNFQAIKQLLAKRIALSYPDFHKSFDIYTDASKYQLGAVITQDKKPIAFYSRKLTDAQTRYTVGELELLSIVETLREFRTILLGHRINIFTDHKNLTFEKSTTDRVRRWKLIIEEYGPNLIYVKGHKNIIADALSRLPICEVPMDESYFFQECFADDDEFPLSFDVISEEQNNDELLQAKVQQNPDRYVRRTINDHQLIFCDDKIVIPEDLQPRILEWYHKNLMHPGVTRMQQTVLQHFIWDNLRRHIEDFVRSCKTCQHYKKQTKKYGKLPVKTQDETILPWTTVAVDTIGPWTIPQQNRSKKDKITLIALTIIDVQTCFMEIVALSDGESATVAAAFDQYWLCRYPRPLKCIIDNGTEFTGIEFQELLQSYGISPIRTTVRNPQANAVLERTHHVIANMLRTSILMRYQLDTIQDRQALLAPVQWAMNSTYHTTLQATPGQLAFQRDMIMPTTFLANWAHIQARRQHQTYIDHIRENAVRISHDYKENDQVLIRRDVNYPYLGKLAKPTEGPFRIIDISLLPINGTVVIARGPNHTERINIRRLVPYIA
jgi:transposase InsO family protein